MNFSLRENRIKDPVGDSCTELSTYAANPCFAKKSWMYEYALPAE